MKLMNLSAKTQAIMATVTAMAVAAPKALNPSAFLSIIGQVILSNLQIRWR